MDTTNNEYWLLRLQKSPLLRLAASDSKKEDSFADGPSGSDSPSSRGVSTEGMPIPTVPGKSDTDQSD